MLAEMRMIRWLCGHTILDRFRNVVIREKVRVAPLEEKIRETRLRWFGYVRRSSVNAPVKRCEEINLMQCRIGRGRLKMSGNKVIRGSIKCLGLTEDMAQDRNMWRSKCKMVDHRQRASALVVGVVV